MTLDVNTIDVIAFDLFGTVVDMSGVPIEEMKDYAHQLRKFQRGGWEPLELPEHWGQLLAFDDAVEGLRMLSEEFRVVTCSNAPLGLQNSLALINGLPFDAIVPLEANRVYKTDPKAYLTVCQVMRVKPENVLMVTANKDFGDLEASVAVGMQSVLIRDDKIPTITALAEALK